MANDSSSNSDQSCKWWYTAKRISTTYFLWALIFISLLSACQQSKDIWDITEPSVTPGWITFKEEANVNPRTLFDDYAEIFRLTPGNKMVIVSEESDELGMVHYRYLQYYREIPIENAEFIVHAKGNRALKANGTLAMNFTPSETTPAISEEDALQIAMKLIPSERYFREDKLVEDLGSADSKGEGSEYRPKGQLIFAQKPNTDSDEWVLAWMFKVYALPLDRSRQVYINASDGSVLKELPLFANCHAGSGDTTFRGNQQFNTKNTNNRFYLTNDCNGNELKAVLLDNTNKAVDIFDDDNNWSGNNRSLVTSYWALDITYDYFRLVHGRNSYDNKNSNMIIYNNPNLMVNGVANPNNASGGGGVINIGFGSTDSDNDDYNTVDIVGHEFAHSLIETSAGLGYDAAKESAALNESFSDIMGQLVERWEEQNQNPDWVIGDDKGCTGGAICRDLKNPKTYNQPDTYKGKYWQSTGTIDPHVNGNVQNRWFYLLTDGGTGTNSETNVQYSINGIGIQKSGKIAYRTLTRYLNSNSDYEDAREGSINAAEDLYGVDSTEVGQVIKAWCAVGLCPYTQPKQPDRFDKKGGNPNPTSPDNNNALAGATPLGTNTLRGPILLVTDSLDWVIDGNEPPRMWLSSLNIFPFDDKDYFKITSPDVQNLLGACAIPSLAFNFTNNVNAKIYNGNAVVKNFTNASYFSTPILGIGPSSFAISVEPAFPGQILDYDMQISYFLSFDKDCGETEVRPEWELIKECIMCDYKILSEINRVILDPPYRTKNKVPVGDYYFYYDGESDVVDIPVQVMSGNKLRAELVDDKGNIIVTADDIEETEEGSVLRLKSEGIRQGVYSIHFSGFGNGTEVSIKLPGR
jgi:Zn-dependent metalloprotease